MYQSVVDAFDKFNGEFEYVCFNSPGGFYKPGVKIAKFLAMKKAKTCLADVQVLDTRKEPIENVRCSSMCPFILISSSSRHYTGSGKAVVKVHRLGRKLKDGWPSWPAEFHSYVESTKYRDLINSSLEQDKSKFDKLYELALSTSFYDDIYVLTPLEISKSNIFNQ